MRGERRKEGCRKEDGTYSAGGSITSVEAGGANVAKRGGQRKGGKGDRSVSSKQTHKGDGILDRGLFTHEILFPIQSGVSLLLSTMTCEGEGAAERRASVGRVAGSDFEAQARGGKGFTKIAIPQRGMAHPKARFSRKRGNGTRGQAAKTKERKGVFDFERETHQSQGCSCTWTTRRGTSS